MANISIDKEFSTLFPPLTAGEYSLLEESLRKEGCRDPIRVWNGAIVDGHNRYEICKKHDIAFEVIEMPFEDRDQATLWIIENQLGRRNLSVVDKVQLAKQHTSLLREKARRKQSDGGRYKSQMKAAETPEAFVNTVKSSDDQVSSEPINVRKEISKISGVSEGTVSKILKIDRECPDLLEPIRHGEMSVDKAYRTISRPAVTRSSGGPELCAPPDIIESARIVMGSIDTDPASNEEAQEWIRAGKCYTAGDDGLAGEWSGNVWLYPPRTAELVSRFSEKLLSELSAGHIRSAIVLVDNATDTAWFQTMAERASALCFHKGPVRFIRSGDKRSVSWDKGQVLMYFGPDAEAFREVFSITGLVLQPMAATA